MSALNTVRAAKLACLGAFRYWYILEYTDIGRGLSPQQHEILATLAQAGKAIPIVDLVTLYWGPYDEAEIDQRERAGTLKAFDRDRMFACRRAVDALERRGLVQVVAVKARWRRRMWDDYKDVRAAHLLAVKLLPAASKAAQTGSNRPPGST